MAVEVVEVSVEVVDIAEIEEEIVEAPTVPHKAGTLNPLNLLHNQGHIKDPNILTFQLEPGQGARCIIAGGRRHFSVRNHRPVRGKTSSFQKLPNETVTSSA